MRGVERELKLEVPEGPVEEWLAPAVAPATFGPPRRRHLAADYWDTDDLRLAAWGVTLRYRTGEGPFGRWTLKLCEPSSAPAVLVRREIDDAGLPDRVPAFLDRLVTAFRRRSALAPVATVRTVRTERDVRSPDGAAVAVLADDWVEAEAGGRATPAYRELELELTDEGDAAATALLDAARDEVERRGGRPSVVPKAVRALGRPPPELADVDDPGRSPTGAVRAALVSSTRRLLVHDPSTRLDDDVEGVHQQRVAVRRLRSDLRTFRPFLKGRWAEDLRARLASLDDVLGPVRDLDVLRGFVDADLDGLDFGARPVAVRLTHRLERARAARMDALTAEMDGAAYVSLLDDLVAAAKGVVAADGAGDRWRRRMGRALDRRWRRLSATVDGYGPASGDGELHRIRILSRRARFTCDALAPVFGPHVAELAARLADVQSVLGDEHDAVITAGWYGAAAAGAPPRVVADLGLLAALATDRAAAARRRWTTAWARARQAAHVAAAEGAVVTFDPV